MESVRELEKQANELLSEPSQPISTLINQQGSSKANKLNLIFIRLKKCGNGTLESL
jgi:hypothetical protein